MRGIYQAPLTLWGRETGNGFGTPTLQKQRGLKRLTMLELPD